MFILMVQTFFDRHQVLGEGANATDSWEMGLVELLYCDRKDAAKLLVSGKNEKYSPGTFCRLSFSNVMYFDVGTEQHCQRPDKVEPANCFPATKSGDFWFRSQQKG